MDHGFLRVNLSEISEHVRVTIDDLDPALSSKVREIIEKQWGKSLADLKDLNVGQFYERLIRDDLIFYRPTNRYVLQAKFLHTREIRRVTFSITA